MKHLILKNHTGLGYAEFEIRGPEVSMQRLGSQIDVEFVESLPLAYLPSPVGDGKVMKFARYLVALIPKENVPPELWTERVELRLNVKQAGLLLCHRELGEPLWLGKEEQIAGKFRWWAVTVNGETAGRGDGDKLCHMLEGFQLQVAP